MCVCVCLNWCLMDCFVNSFGKKGFCFLSEPLIRKIWHSKTYFFMTLCLNHVRLRIFIGFCLYTVLYLLHLPFLSHYVATLEQGHCRIFCICMMFLQEWHLPGCVMLYLEHEHWMVIGCVFLLFFFSVFFLCYCHFEFLLLFLIS